MSKYSLYREVKKVPSKPRKVDYNKIYELYDNGWKLEAIAEQLNCSYGTVQHALRVRNK